MPAYDHDELDAICAQHRTPTRLDAACQTTSDRDTELSNGLLRIGGTHAPISGEEDAEKIISRGQLYHGTHDRFPLRSSSTLRETPKG